MYKKIMVPLDGSELAECVFPHLETVVKGCHPPAEVIVVQAVEPLSVPYGREISQFTSLEQVKAFHGPGRAPAPAVYQAHHSYGPVINVCQPGRHDPDHPGVPALSGQDQHRPPRQLAPADGPLLGPTPQLADIRQ